MLNWIFCSKSHAIDPRVSAHLSLILRLEWEIICFQAHLSCWENSFHCSYVTGVLMFCCLWTTAHLQYLEAAQNSLLCGPLRTQLLQSQQGSRRITGLTLTPFHFLLVTATAKEQRGKWNRILQLLSHSTPDRTSVSSLRPAVPLWRALCSQYALRESGLACTWLCLNICLLD